MAGLLSFACFWIPSGSPWSASNLRNKVFTKSSRLFVMLRISDFGVMSILLGGGTVSRDTFHLAFREVILNLVPYCIADLNIEVY